MSIKHFGSRHFAAKEFLAIAGGISAVSPSVPAVPSTPTFVFGGGGTTAGQQASFDAMWSALVEGLRAEGRELEATKKRSVTVDVEPIVVDMTFERFEENELMVAGYAGMVASERSCLPALFVLGLGIGIGAALVVAARRDA